MWLEDAVCMKLKTSVTAKTTHKKTKWNNFVELGIMQTNLIVPPSCPLFWNLLILDAPSIIYRF